MERFRIDFTSSNHFPDGKTLGEYGEKNAVQLIITPPIDLAVRDEIKSYVVAFSTDRGPVRYGPVPKSGLITVPVGRALTVGSALSVQLEGYDSDGEFIIKSPVISGIMISGSIADGNCSCEENDKNHIPGHLHDNLELLDSLTVKDGVLCYDGNTVSVEDKARTVVLLASEGTFSVMTAEPFYGSMAFVSLPDKDGVSYIPDGADIVSVEINIKSESEPEWVDLRDMIQVEPHIPYFINQRKAYYSAYSSGIVVANVTFMNDNVNAFYEAAESYSCSGLRVRYIFEGGNN